MTVNICVKRRGVLYFDSSAS